VVRHRSRTGRFAGPHRVLHRRSHGKPGGIAIDGTKLNGAASRHRAMRYQRMHEAWRALKEQIGELLAKGRAIGAAERNEEEVDIREERLKVIAAACERLIRRQKRPIRPKGAVKRRSASLQARLWHDRWPIIPDACRSRHADAAHQQSKLERRTQAAAAASDCAWRDR